MVTSAENICSSALVLVGSGGINSFNDPVREAEVAFDHYALTLEDLLTRHPWKFATAQRQLARSVDAPLFGYAHAYQLPSDCLEILNMESAAAYEVLENKLYCDLEEVKISYLFRPVEARFPPYFARLLVFELAAVFAMALADDESKSEKWEKKAREQERKARHTDSKQQPSAKVRPNNNILAAVRFT